MNEKTELAKTEEDRIKLHLGQLFMDALLSDASAKPRSQLVESLVNDIRDGIAAEQAEISQALTSSIQSEKDALEAERQGFLKEAQGILPAQISQRPGGIFSSDQREFIDEEASEAERHNLRQKLSDEGNGVDQTSPESESALLPKWIEQNNFLAGGAIGMVLALLFATIGAGLIYGMYLRSNQQIGLVESDRLASLNGFCEDLRGAQAESVEESETDPVAEVEAVPAENKADESEDKEASESVAKNAAIDVVTLAKLCPISEAEQAQGANETSER